MIELLGDVTGVDPRGLGGAVVVVVVRVSRVMLNRTWSKEGGSGLVPVAVWMG